MVEKITRGLEIAEREMLEEKARNIGIFVVTIPVIMLLVKYVMGV